jgi:hypothetical protein
MNGDVPNAGNNVENFQALNQNYASTPKVDTLKSEPTYSSQINTTINDESSLMTDQPSQAGFKTSKQMFGFGGQQQFARSSLVMQASTDDKSDIIDVEAESKDGKKGMPKFNAAYSYFVLAIVLACRIMVQWQRKGLNYAYGYTGLGEMANNPIYEISTAYPQLNQWYGLLVGLIYTLPYASFGLVAGKISDSVNRKMALGICILLASMTMGITGFS